MTGRFRDSLLSIDNFPETFFPQKRKLREGKISHFDRQPAFLVYSHHRIEALHQNVRLKYS
jgi:hypothetical protein